MTNTLFNCSLWGDESFSAVLSQKPFWPMLQTVVKDTSPPLMYIIMSFWFKIFGHSEISIRSLSLSFYLGTALIVYLIAKELFNKKAGIIAALLTIFNPFLFPYAFEGRMYFLLLFFVALSFYFLVKKNRLGYILASSAALYSHHFAIFAILAQFIWQLIFELRANKKAIWQLVKPYILIGVSYFPWVYPFYLQTTLVSTGFWLGKPKPKDLVSIFTNFSGYGKVYKIQETIPLLAGIILLLRKYSKKTIKTDMLLFLWAVLPPILTFTVSQTKLSIFYERYLLYCVPPILILLASRLRKVSYPLLAIVMATYLLFSWHCFTHPFKKPFQEFSAWVKENVSQDVFIANYNGKAHHLWETKYYGIRAPIYSPGGPLPFYVGTAQMTNDDVVYQLPEDKKIGLISSDHPDSISINQYRINNYHQIDSLYFSWLERDEN